MCFIIFQDLSYNDLREVPENLEKAICLTVLNLSYNRIEVIPQNLFVNLVDLVYLDLSGNQLGTDNFHVVKQACPFLHVFF